LAHLKLELKLLNIKKKKYWQSYNCQWYKTKAGELSKMCDFNPQIMHGKKQNK